MSDLDALLARSRAPGTFVERRSFTLSRDKALDKLREFTLPHPAQYILELVQAAVFAGATWIAIDVRPRSMTFGWCGGETLTRDELEHLFDHLFVGGGASRRHTTQVAVATNALLQKTPRLLRIESGDGSEAGSVRMDIDADGVGTLGTPQGGMGGTYIHADLGPWWLPRFAESFADEAQLVEERCIYCPVPILLDGSAPFGYHARRAIPGIGMASVETFDDGDRWGTVWVRSPTVLDTGFRIVVGGVWITTLELELMGRIGDRVASGVLCDDGLRKTADQSDIVQDAALVDLIRVAQPAATRSLRAYIKSKKRLDPYIPPKLPAPGEGMPAPKAPEPPPFAPKIVVDRRPKPPRPAPEPPTEVAFAPLEAAPPRLIKPSDVLPVGLPQVGLRPRISVDGLRLLPPDEPVFVVGARISADLSDALGPERFPHRVLRLSAKQRRQFAERFPELPLSPIKTLQEVEFVTRATGGGGRVAEVNVRWDDFGHVTLRAHLDGPRPGLGDPEEGDTPVLLQQWQGRGAAARIDLGLPHLSVQVNRFKNARQRDSTVLGGLVDLVRDRLADLALEVSGLLVRDGPSARGEEVLAAVLAAHARPQFVDDGALRVEAMLPTGWPGGDRLRHTHIAHTSAGPLSLAGFLTLQGTQEVRFLEGVQGGLPESLEALEARFGYGHLVTAELQRSWVLKLEKIGAHWNANPDREVHPDATRILLVLPTLAAFPGSVFETFEDPDAWTSIDLRLPGILAAERWPDGSGWEHALEALGAAIVDALAGRAPLPRGISKTRARGMLALTALRLGLRSAGPSRDRIAHQLGVPLHDTSDVVFTAAGGVRTDREAPVTLDQLKLLRGAGLATTLRFDDPPDLWEGLVDLRREDPRWLVRAPASTTGMKGWIGLRVPFDPTAGILGWSAAVPYALPDPIVGLPVHGLVRFEGNRTALLPHQREKLQVATANLYAGLVALDPGSMGSARRDALKRYRRLYAHARDLPPHERPFRTATLRDVPHPSPASASEAPGPRPDATPSTQAPRPAGVPLGPEAQLLHTLRVRLNPAFARWEHFPLLLATSREELRFWQRKPGPVVAGRVRGSLSIVREHPLVRAAVGGDAEAADLLLLEAARLELGRIAYAHGGDPVADFLAVQEQLLREIAGAANPATDD